jgi:hypothetical protein
MYVTVLLLPIRETLLIYMYSHVTTRMFEASIHFKDPQQQPSTIVGSCSQQHHSDPRPHPD